MTYFNGGDPISDLDDTGVADTTTDSEGSNTEDSYVRPTSPVNARCRGIRQPSYRCGGGRGGNRSDDVTKTTAVKSALRNSGQKTLTTGGGVATATGHSPDTSRFVQFASTSASNSSSGSSLCSWKGWPIDISN